MARSPGGTSMPRSLTVCRLMANMSLVACATGRSAGLAPLRMLPVQSFLRCGSPFVVPIGSLAAAQHLSAIVSNLARATLRARSAKKLERDDEASEARRRGRRNVKALNMAWNQNRGPRGYHHGNLKEA